MGGKKQTKINLNLKLGKFWFKNTLGEKPFFPILVSLARAVASLVRAVISGIKGVSYCLHRICVLKNV